MAGDLSNEDFVKQLLDATVNHYGKLDILVSMYTLKFESQCCKLKNMFWYEYANFIIQIGLSLKKKTPYS